MVKFNVGDRVIMLSTSQYAETSYNPQGIEGTITVYASNHEQYQVDWDNGCSNGGYYNTDIGLVVPSNPNFITVSSLDYMTSTTLSQEDKEIIKEYLYENS